MTRWISVIVFHSSPINNQKVQNSKFQTSTQDCPVISSTVDAFQRCHIFQLYTKRSEFRQVSLQSFPKFTIIDSLIQSLQRGQLAQEVARALVPARVAIQVELVVLLSSPPLARGRDLGDDAIVPPLLVGLSCHFAGNLLLLVIVEVDGGAVLRARVRTLTVQGRGIMRAVEELEELAVGDNGWVKEDLYSLGVYVSKIPC